jgi:hypothetical protein
MESPPHPKPALRSGFDLFPQTDTCNRQNRTSRTSEIQDNADVEPGKRGNQRDTLAQ